MPAENKTVATSPEWGIAIPVEAYRDWFYWQEVKRSRLEALMTHAFPSDPREPLPVIECVLTPEQIAAKEAVSK
jgi:hypothetical protein